MAKCSGRSLFCLLHTVCRKPWALNSTCCITQLDLADTSVTNIHVPAVAHSVPLSAPLAAGRGGRAHTGRAAVEGWVPHADRVAELRTCRCVCVCGGGWRVCVRI
jgi:hypothetical protein